MIKKALFKNLVFKFNKLSSLINLKPREFQIKEGTKCLCLSPHADDESIGMGGLLSMYPDNFDVVLLTDGRKGVKDLSEDEVIRIREAEFRDAMTAAKIQNYIFLKICDKQLLDSFEIFKKLKISDYDYIFLPNIVDQHPDHKAVSLLLRRFLDETAKIKPDLKICFYEVWSPLAFVNGFVDISDAVEKKREMIAAYKSQTAQKNYEYHALGLNQYRGMLKDRKFVEAFCILDVEDFKKISELY